MFRYISFIAFAFLTLTGAAVADEIGNGQVFLTPDEGRIKLFPDAVEFVREVQHLGVVVKQRLAADLGRAFADDSLEVYLAYGEGHAFQGYAIVSEEIGKFRPITFMVGIDSRFAVLGASVLVYRESRGGQVRQPRFLRQYRGKSLKDPVRINRDIVNITGATLSVRSLNFGVRKLLALTEHFYQPRQSAMQ
jgi:hypothetical protein